MYLLLASADASALAKYSIYYNKCISTSCTVTRARNPYILFIILIILRYHFADQIRDGFCGYYDDAYIHYSNRCCSDVPETRMHKGRRLRQVDGENETIAPKPFCAY